MDSNYDLVFEFKLQQTEQERTKTADAFRGQIGVKVGDANANTQDATLVHIHIHSSHKNEFGSPAPRSASFFPERPTSNPSSSITMFSNAVAQNLDAIPPTYKPTNREASLFYFVPVDPTDKNPTEWKCVCGKRRKCNASKFGHGNLFNHVVKAHPNYREVMWVEQQASLDGQAIAATRSPTNQGHPSNNTSGPSVPTVQSTLDHMMDGRSQNMLKWIDWVSMGELPLSWVDDERNRTYSCLQPICSKTMKKYSFRLVSVIEKDITRRVLAAGKYSLVFDGWSSNGRHFIGKQTSVHSFDQTHTVSCTGTHV